MGTTKCHQSRKIKVEGICGQLGLQRKEKIPVLTKMCCSTRKETRHGKCNYRDKMRVTHDDVLIQLGSIQVFHGKWEKARIGVILFLLS